jgi:hypothetical protein
MIQPRELPITAAVTRKLKRGPSCLSTMNIFSDRAEVQGDKKRTWEAKEASQRKGARKSWKGKRIGLARATTTSEMRRNDERKSEKANWPTTSVAEPSSVAGYMRKGTKYMAEAKSVPKKETGIWCGRPSSSGERSLVTVVLGRGAEYKDALR